MIQYHSCNICNKKIQAGPIGLIDQIKQELFIYKGSVMKMAILINMINESKK